MTALNPLVQSDLKLIEGDLYLKLLMLIYYMDFVKFIDFLEASDNKIILYSLKKIPTII